MPKIAIIGTTSWGITLGALLARKGLQVRLWARTEEEASQLRNLGPNSDLLPVEMTSAPSRLEVAIKMFPLMRA